MEKLEHIFRKLTEKQQSDIYFSIFVFFMCFVDSDLNKGINDGE